MITYYFNTIHNKKLQQLDKPKAGCWIHLDSPEPSDLEELCTDLKLDHTIISDILDPYEVPRLEIEAGSLYIFTRVISFDPSDSVTSPLLIIINPHHLISISPSPSTDFIRRFTTNGYDLVTTQRNKLLLQLLVHINTLYQKHIDFLRKSVRQTVVNLESITNAQLKQLVHQESALNEILTSLEPNNLTAEKILNGKHLQLYEDDKDLIEDLILSNNQLIQLSRSSIKSISSAREAYTTIISNNLNKTMKLLTALTVILTVPTIVGTLYGMNIPLPFADHPQAFFGIITLTIAVTSLLTYFFAKNDLL